ncbi:hypothetical protein [Variovorax sp. PBS-H4]|uniref:hypothetical protein n=1 Tax=Variovorax sp. PBS-H4 TaxID=434008 RepID=UPI0013A52C74|nr:hypothetical protein [Variovorax sp. PBS-H4]
MDPDPAEPVASLEDGLPAVEGHEATETLDRSIVPEIRSEAREEAGLDIAHIVPAAFEWPDELPVGITAAEPRAVAPRGKPVLKNAAIGVGVAISVLALVLGYLRSGQDGDAGTTEAATPPQPAQVQNVPRLAAAAVPAELPAAAQVPAAAPVPVAPVVPVPAVAAVPASAMPAPEAGRTRCNEALAALALCPDAAGAR